MRSLAPTDFSQHPARFVELLLQRYGFGLTFEFSRYYYRPRSLEDERELIYVPAYEFSPSKIEQLLRALPDGYELALNSRVYTSPNQYAHIAMIDCSARDFGEIRKIATVLPRDFSHTFFWYNSGRSFHGYSSQLLDSRGWVSFMGNLLLVNTPGHPSIVDPRWIGHRLISGYSALRWSWNTVQYMHEPRFVSTWMA